MAQARAQRTTRKATKRKAPARTPRKAQSRTPKLAVSTEPSRLQLAHGISRYLVECQDRKGSSTMGLRVMTARTPEQIQKGIDKLEARLATANTPIVELKIRSQLIAWKAALAAQSNGKTAFSARAFFIEHAAQFAVIHDLSYAAFREMGVEASVLKEAGIKP